MRSHEPYFFRFGALFLIVLCFFAIVTARLVQVQFLQHDAFSDTAATQQRRQLAIGPKRGRIYDRNLRLMATSTPSPSIYADPTQMGNVRHAADVLSRALSLDAHTLHERFLARSRSRFIWVKRRIEPVQYTAFQAIDRRQIPGVHVRWEQKRHYPLSRLACHVLGLVDVDGVGRLGIERTLQDCLAGSAGRQTMAVDGRGRRRVAPARGDRATTDGNSLVLTIDTVIQRIAEEEIRENAKVYEPLSITALVMETATGKILAMATTPDFDPNDPAADPVKHMLNRAVQARYEPGSTFKPFILAAALEEQLTSLDDRVFCYNGVYRIGRRVLHDHHGYGWLTSAQVVIKSSNIGIARIGEQLGDDLLQKYMDVYRFARPTGIELPDELRGKVTSPQAWSSYTTTSVPMGHEIAVTPLRLLTAFNALVNGGVMIEPRLVNAVLDDGFRIVKPLSPAHRRRVVSARTADMMLDDVLSRVVEEGTGQRARLDRWRLGGKTGTAQKVLDDGTYSHSLYVASFLCVAPVEDPQVTILVLSDGATKGPSRFGGVVSAPVAARIARRTLEYMDVAPSSELAGRRRNRSTNARAALPRAMETDG